MKLMKRFWVLMLLVSFLSCKKESNNPTPKDETYLNVAYGTDTAQKMDVYLPGVRSITETKVLIVIHGGAWFSGDKSEFTEFVPALKKRLSNYAMFNINYRLAKVGGNFFPTQEDDVKAAVNYIYSKAEEYKINKDKIVLLGASAGAHLALQEAYKNDQGKIKAVVDFFGPADMTALYNFSPSITRSLMQLLLSGAPTSNPQMYQLSSPINFVSAQSPPTIILHGGKDDVVPIASSVQLKDKLQANGVITVMYTYPNEGHGWFGPTLEDSFDKIAAFLLSQVK